tara:strand:- start:604 stop:1257 length:654 start_codon:yes stop_codon:yes gene_type:complete
MAGVAGPTIPGVTDGLVFYVDAALSYTSGSTIWYDLVGSGNTTLTNGPTFDRENGGSIVFDGSNDYATAGYQMPTQSSTTTFSWNLWIYLYSGNGNNDVIFGNRYGPANLQFIKITPTNWEYYSGGGEFISYSIPTNQWINLCVVKNQGTHYYYSNASQVGTRSSNKSIVANPVFMGGDLTRETANVQFAFATIYDRALSLTEVTQNYNALKSRFNL